MTQDKTTIDKLEAIGGRIVSKIADILRWIAVLTPIAATGLIWVYGFLVVIGLNVFAVSDWTIFGVEPFFILSKTNKPYIQIAWASITISTLPALLVASKLLKKDYVPLRGVDGKTGKTGVWKLPPERFEEITVLDIYDSKKEIGVDGLNKVEFSDGKIGYEADLYYKDTNIAMSSWYAGETPSEVRQRKSAIDDIRGEFLLLVNAALDTIAGKSRAAREAGAAEINESIRRRELATLQTEGTPTTPLQDYLEDGYDRLQRVEGQRTRDTPRDAELRQRFKAADADEGGDSGDDE